jgi:hypothetical protein
MDYLNNFNQEFQLQTLLSEAKVILNKEGDINSDRENLSQIIDRVDFLLGKHDELYEKFTELFTSMGQFDFSKRLDFVENREVINFIISGLNMLNDEYQAHAINKKLLHNFFKSCSIKNVLAVITNSDGFIYFANPGDSQLVGFNDDTLHDQSIHSIFTDFHIVEDRIKGEGSIKNIDVELKWNGNKIHANLDVTICNSNGKIESLIYIIKLV